MSANHLRVVEPALDAVFQSLNTAMRSTTFAEDYDEQLKTLERIWCVKDANARAELTANFCRRVGVNESRLSAIMELTVNTDRLKALRLPRDREPVRLSDERIFPTWGWFGQYLDWAGPTSSPLAWHFWCAVSLIAAACRRRVWVDAGMDEPVFLCNYFFLVGPSGSGKSTAIKKARDVLTRTNTRLRRAGTQMTPPQDITIYQGPPAGSFESWLDEFSTYHAELTQVDPTDPNSEVEPALVVRPDCCCYIAQDEAVVLIGKDQQSSERWFNGLFQMSDCPTEWRDSKISARMNGQSRELYNVALTCLFGSAPEHLLSRVSSAIFSGGFLGRTIISARTHSGRMHSSRADTDPVEAERLAGQLALLAQGPVRRLQMTDEAREWYDEFLAENHARVLSSDPRYVGAYERAGWHICKTAGVLCVAESMASGRIKKELTLKHMQLARELVELERPGAEALVGQSRPATDQDVSEALYREVEKAGEIEYTNLLRRCLYATPTKRAFDWHLHTLIAAKRLTRKRSPVDNLWRIRCSYIKDEELEDWT